MWNDSNNHPPHNNYGPPPSFPGGPTPSFPSPSGFPSPGAGFPASGGFPSPHAGYAPSYAPPPGPPQGPYGAPSYAPASGPPPPQGYGHNSYGPPSGPPPIGSRPGTGSYGPPSGPPPPITYGGGPPPGPPPRNSYPGQQPTSGYPGEQHRQQHPASGGYPGQGQQGGPPPVSQNRPYNQQGPPRPPAQAQHYGPTFQGAHNQQQQPYFQYSQCTGKRKALCIGINYIGKKGQLAGCINDARGIQNFLLSHKYMEDDIVMLTDDSRNPKQIPTRQNMINAMRWLVAGAAPNDSLFFHYSGHGGQAKDLDGDEPDGFDEVIYPLDHETSGHIVDDMMHDIMVKPLPAGCRLTAIFDSCHSGGTALDLPYVYSTEGKIKEPNLAAEAGQGLLSAVSSYAKGDMGGVFKSAMGIVKSATGNNQKVEARNRQTKTSPADVIQWSGCKDSQTSADTQEQGTATGAMSYAFITVLRQNPQQSYQQLLNNIRDILKAKYSQKPQLSASHPMDTDLMFIC